MEGAGIQQAKPHAQQLWTGRGVRSGLYKLVERFKRAFLRLYDDRTALLPAKASAGESGCTPRAPPS
jgi:hypothetical protein